jgi:hypothetical protein
LSTKIDPLIEMAQDIAGYTHDPAGFARYAYGWGDGELSDSQGPRGWQAKVNGFISQQLSNPATRFQPCCIAISSGHGIGKSAEIGMLVNWGMSTCEGCKVVITAGTGTQLATKTVPEVSKWVRRSVNSHWWDVQATSIRFRSEKWQANWRTDFITWSEHNTEAFAGLHNKLKRIILIFDEASAIADKVWEVAEGALTDENTEIIWLAFGNPTQNTGRFKECFGRFKHRWKTLQIDSRDVEGTNKEQIAKWIEDYGDDSDFVRVRVKGEFPRAGSTQFIASDVVSRCRKFKAEAYESLPKILSVDVARFGDDQTVLGTRQGRKARILSKLRGLDTVQVAERVIEAMEKEKPDGTVIDGDGIGAGVIDHMQHRGYGISQGVFEFHGGAPARDGAAYFNRRAEVWGLMRDALKADMELPDDPELETDLTGPQYGFSPKQQIQLERKEDMKKRGLASPDCGDMLAMTFAVQIAAPDRQMQMPQHYGSDAWMA